MFKVPISEHRRESLSVMKTEGGILLFYGSGLLNNQ